LDIRNDIVITEDSSPTWQKRYWSIMGQGDGLSCPLLPICAKPRKKACPYYDSDIGRILEIIEVPRYDFNGLDFVCRGTDCPIFKMTEHLALDLLTDAGIMKPPVPLDLVSQADPDRKVEILHYPLKKCHGAAWDIEGKWIIYLNEHDIPEIQRVTAFHEAFHILQRRHGKQFTDHKGKCCGGTFDELLANYFAVSVLMPRKWVAAIWPHEKDIDKLATIFNVTQPTVQIRLRRFGLI